MNNNFFNPIFNIGRIKMHPLIEGEVIKSVFYLKEFTKQSNLKEYNNFTGADINGYKNIKITSPFNKAKNLFEVGYVSFAKCDDDEYILKLQKKGKKEKIIGYPLKDNTLPIIDFGEVTEDSFKEFGLVKSGVLRCQVDGFSDYGEVFLFATKNKDTINAISNSLQTIEAMIGGLEGVTLNLKALETRVKVGKIKYDEEEDREYIEQVEVIKPFLKISVNNIVKAKEEHLSYLNAIGKVGEIDKVWETNNIEDVDNIIHYKDAIEQGKVFEFDGVVDSDNNSDTPPAMSEEEIDKKDIKNILKQLLPKNEIEVTTLLINLYNRLKKDKNRFKDILKDEIIEDGKVKNNKILKQIALINQKETTKNTKTTQKKQGSLL